MHFQVQAKPTSFLDSVHSCTQKPLTKAALFVIAFLAAGGAIAFHFTGLGMIPLVACSVVSGVSFGMFVLACVCSAKKKVAVPNDGLSNDERAELVALEIPNEFLQTFAWKIESLFQKVAPDKVAAQFQVLINLNPWTEKLKVLVQAVLQARILSLLQMAQILEGLNWPNVIGSKEEFLTQEFIAFYRETLHPNAKMTEGNNLLQIELNLNHAIGVKVGIEAHETLPNSLAKALFWVVQQFDAEVQRKKNAPPPPVMYMAPPRPEGLELNIVNDGAGYSSGFLKPLISMIDDQNMTHLLRMQMWTSPFTQADCEFVIDFMDANPQLQFLRIKLEDPADGGFNLGKSKLQSRFGSKIRL